MMSRAAVTLLVLAAVSFASRSDIVVEIKQGSLRGTTLTSRRSNRTFFAFMGIPYAKPPVGELRFKISMPAGKWDGVRDASEEGPICPQTSDMNQAVGEEDCLFLNVFTPKVPSGPEDSLKPVMVWLHGGGFFYGSGNRNFSGPDYLVDGGVIFVSINYRLGALGFLSLQNEEVPGNAGLKDQVLALKWVQENIKTFGGDPREVTIIGESAGAVSVHYHLLSPMSKGLFHRAISQSGSAVNPWSFQTPNSSLKASFLMGRKLGVNTRNPRVLLQKLRNVTPAQITEAFNTMFPTVVYINVPIGPTTDKRAASGEVFLPDTPTNIMSAGRFQKLPYITGVTSNEGIIMTSAIKSIINQTTNENTQPDLSKGLGFGENNIISQEIDKKIKDFYFGGVNERNATLLQYVNYVSDSQIVNGVYCTAKTQTAHSKYPVYFYEFSFNTNNSVYKNLFGGADLPGASHADDLAFLFTTPLLAQDFEPTSPEYLTSIRMLKMWTNFAKTGNPTPGPDPLLQGVIWSPVTTSEFAYLNIDTDLKLQHDFRKTSIAFWRQLYRKYTPHSAC